MRRLLAAVLLAAALPAAAQYPSKPVRFVNPFPPGGPLDLMGRLLSDRLGTALGKPVIVENKPGAAGNIGAAEVARAAPDGHTALLTLFSIITSNPHLYPNLPFDPLKDFAPVVAIATSDSVLIVHPSIAASSVSELVAYAKANPGRVNYASAGKASPGHLTAEYFSRQTGARMTHVPYKGNAEAIRSVLAGETQVFFTPTTGALAQIQAGKVKALAVYLTDRIDELPNVPSLDAQGVKGFDPKSLPFWYGLLVPAGTPREAIARLNAETSKVLKDPEVANRLRAARIFPIGGTPEEFGAMMRDGYAAWGKVIRETGVKGSNEALVVQPNFVFIMADDLGYADLGCYGGRLDCSPVLDRMAAEGLRFTQGYANSSVCSPTRFALMTGRWQHRLRGGADEPIASMRRGSATLGLPPEHPTLASLLAKAGYATALIGKWHLGWLPHFGPLKSGYQEFFGAMSGGLDYFTHRDSAGAHDLWDGERECNDAGYLTDLFSEKAAAFIRRARKPFLLSLHYTAPHWPWETRDDEAEARRLEKIFHTDGGSVHTYAKMIRHMDEGIGQVLDALRAAGAGENTIVVFTSDNGGERYSDTWPLIGKKMDLLEGGIRVPYIVRWPARIKPGGTTAQLAITMDWVPTFLAAAGASPDPRYPLDGIDLLPVFEGKAIERDLFWRMKFRAQKAMRSGDWKYLSIEGHEYLFNLARDERERANVAKRFPDQLVELKAKFAAWEASLPPIPDDAKFSLVYGPAELPQPS